MPTYSKKPGGGCGCAGFGRQSAFGSNADAFFYPLNKAHVNGCLQNSGYYRNNYAPLTQSSGFGSNKPVMRIGSKKKS